jgi:hypothetical protein
MKVTKAKYVVEFTEEEKKAITTVCHMVDSLYEDGICTDLKCEDCPFYNDFCMNGTDDSKIISLKQRIEKFINGTD